MTKHIYVNIVMKVVVFLARKSDIDWEQLKKEYINDPSETFQSLADRYGTSKSAVFRASRAGRWIELRNEVKEKSFQKHVESLTRKSVYRFASLQTVSDMIVTMITKAIESIENPVEVDPSVWKQYTAALKDIKDIQMIKSVFDKADKPDENREIIIKFADQENKEYLE